MKLKDEKELPAIIFCFDRGLIQFLAHMQLKLIERLESITWKQMSGDEKC